MNSHLRDASPATRAAASRPNGGRGRRKLPSGRLLLFATLVVCAAAFAASGSAAKQSKTALTTPSGLQTFLRSAHASRLPSAARVEVPTFSRTPAFAWNPVRGATRYQFQLSTSKTFLADNAMIWTAKMTSPAASVPLALPWITGEPASIFWRVRALGPKGLSQWSKPGAFNMRWTQQPKPLTSGPGFIRWSTVDGATGYQVWFLNAGDTESAVPLGKVISTITNVADEREYYLTETVPSTVVYWRVRAERKVYGGAKNSLPAVSFGPWSHVFKSTNPLPATTVPAAAEATSTTATGDPLNDKYARLRPLSAVSDVTSSGGGARRHSLVPAITVGGNPTTPGNLYRVYLFTDRDCVNRVFTGYPVTSPAYAPRSTGGGVLDAGVHRMADGTNVTPTELGAGADPAAATTSTTTGGTGTTTGTTPAATGTEPAGPAKVDLWDTRGRYYAVAVPVVTILPPAPEGAPGAPAAPAPTTVSGAVYQDLELPQDICAKGRFLTFGKASRTPALTSRGAPTATGLSPTGRLLTAVTPKPRFYGSPLVTWEPASGAISYQVQWSKSKYPWKAAGTIKTPATSATLPLTPGAWWYRVRGINDALPGNQLMSWSKQVPIVITGPTFGVRNG